MKISGYRNDWTQGVLFDEPVTCHGQRRNEVGNLAEELAVDFLGGRRHKVDGRSNYCPDISIKIGRRIHYYECKAAGRTRQTFVYSGRLQKDRLFVDSGKQLHYIIWHHMTSLKGAESVSDLKALVLANMICVYVIPFAAIEAECVGRSPMKLNSNYGGQHNRPGYGTGYRMPLSAFSPFVKESFPEGITDVVRSWWWGRHEGK